MNEDQINELKSLVDELTTQGLSTADIQSRVDQRKAEFAETVEVTEEIQTEPKGKTNGAVAKGATATPKTGQAPESTESESVDTSLDSIDPLDNSKEAILKRRKLNALEEAAIMQQPVELEEVVVTAEAPKPFSYWKDLVLSPEYEEAFEQIQKDTGEFASTKDQGVLEYIKQFGKAIYAPASKEEEPTYETLPIDLFTRIEIAKKLDKRTLQKAKGGFLNLKEKEQLIKDAKAKVVERSLFTLENDLENTLEEYDKQYDPIKAEAKAVQDRINSTFNFENDKPIIATQASADLYNNLIDKYSVLQEEAKALNKGRNTLIENYETDINALQTEYGIDLASGVINNNFQLTDEIEEFNKKVSENTGADLTARLMGGLWKTGKDFIFAVPQLATYATDLFTDQDTYSYFDAWNDVTSNLTNYNTLGEPEASEVVNEEGRYVKDPKEYLRMTADMLPFTLGIIASARKGDLKGTQKILGNVLGGKKGRIYGLDPKLKQNIAMGDAAFKMTVNDNIREGRQQGLSDAQSLAYGTTKSLSTAISQAVMPDINFLKSGAGKSLLTNFRGNLKNATDKKAISSAAQTFFGNLSKELGEEEIEAVLDLGTKYAFGLGLPDWQGFMKEQKQLVAGTMMLSGSLGSIGATNTFKAVKDQTYKGIIKNQNLLLDQIQMQKNMAVKSGDFEMAEKLNNAEYFTRNIVRAAAVSPENVTAEQLDLVVEKQKLLEKRKKLDPSFRKEVDQEIDVIDEKISNSRVQKSREEVQRKIEKGVTKLADELGIVSETVADDEAKLNRLNELKKEGYTVDEKDSTNYGTILTNDKGDTTIVFNDQANKEDNVITTGAHEMLHAVLLKTVSQNPGVAENLGTSLIDALKTINAEQVTNEYRNRLKDYLDDADLTSDEAFEEGLTLLSEAMINGDIVYKESLAQKIGNGLERLFGLAGGRAIFNDGKDVFKFIKDYNNSLIKGKVSQRVLETAKEGALGTLTQVDTTAETKAQPKKAASIRSSRGQEFIGLAQEGILTNENLVETIKSPSSTSEDKFGAIEAVVENNWPVISKAVKFNPTGTIPMEAVKEAVTEQIQGIFPGRGTALFDSYNPKTSQVNTFIGSTLGPRQAEILERAQAIGGTTQGVDISEARGIAAEEKKVAKAEPTITKLIDSRKFGPATRVDIDNIVTIEKGARPSFRELTEQNLDEVSNKVFNVPGKKIRGKETLTDAEAKSLQRLFVDPNNIRKLIKTMPPYNIAGSETVISEQGEAIDVSRDIKGKSIGLSNKFIKKYYQPVTRAIPGISNPKGRSLGTTSQTQVYELKPEYTGRITDEIVKQIQDDVGVTESGVPNQKISAENRSKYGTTLTGFAKTYLANAINAAGRGKQATKQEQADTGAGKAKRAASKRIPLENRNSFIFSDSSDYDFASNARDWRKILNSLGIEQIDMSTEKSRQKFLNTAIETGLTEEIPESVWLTLGGTSERFVDEAQGVYYDPDLKAAVTKEGFEIRTDIGIGLRDYKRGLPFRTKAEAEAWIADSKKSGVKFAPETEASKAMAEKFGYNKKNDLSKKLNDSDFVAQQDLSLQGLKDLFNTFERYINKGDNKNERAAIVAVMLGSTSAHQGHFMRVAAPVRFYQEGYLDGPKGKTMVEEHTLPATILAKYLFLESYDGKVNKVWPNVERNYFQGALLKESDLKLKGRSDINEKAFNYTEKTPEGWQMSDNIWARYFNLDVASNRFGIDPNTIKLTGGKSVFDIYNVDATGSRISDAGNLSRRRASRRNNSTIPKGSRVKNTDSMPNVLDNMSNLDTEAKQANKEFYDSLDLNKEFNDILEVKTGIASEKRYKRVKAEVVGANKGRFQFFIPPSAEDFTGLLYSTLAKGKLGDAQMAWYKKNLLDPYGKAMNELSSARIAMMNDYKALKKELKLVPKDLRKKVPGEPFTQEQAVRVYIWQKQGMSVPGISEADMQDLSDFVEGKEDLKTFADQLMYIQKGDQYAGPKEGWPAGTITTDMLEGLNTIKRAKALEQWQANADEIFSEENLNKLEAAYGKPYRKAMENMLQRMKSGRNRNFQGDTLTGRVTDWLTGSIGTIMFFNTRSAILQTISSINFVNFTDNNILAAGKAFANQKQYWSDFMTLMNSDFLKERRGGLRINVNEADIADMAKRGGARGVVNKLLEFGFTPTQIADSFAIASGGATFYRNRIKSLKKQGMTDAEAEAQAFVDFRETAEESQQSSRPDRISMQQAGPLGRIVLAFANTPAQYARLIKKAASDLKNGRGDAKTNISKIIYYGVAQNLLFNALQQALFAFAFDEDEEDTDEQQKKYVSIANGMMDSLLRGMGLGGAVVSVGKNAIKRIIDEMEKKQPKLEKVGYELTKLSPPISAKLSRINQAARSYQWDKKDMMEKGWSLDNPAYLASANVIAALTNIPLDRAIKKTNNVVTATSQDLETWERLALLGGWQDWEIGIDEENKTNKPQPRKSTSKYKKSKIK